MILADTSGLLAFFNPREPEHGRIRSYLEQDDSPLVVSPYVVAELDYLVGSRIGVDAELAVLAELAGGAYVLPEIGPILLAKCHDVVDQYRDLRIGVCDASIVVLSERFKTRRVLTLDERHFRAIQTTAGEPFQLPGD